jgi:stage II sporulation protein D
VTPGVRRVPRIAAAVLGGALALGAAAAGAAPGPVRVLVREGDPAVTVRGDEAVSLLAGARRLAVLPARASATIAAGRGGLLLNAQPLGVEAVTLRTSPAGFLALDGRSFRGEVEIRRGGNGGLLAINVLDLEDYLQGVVREEVPVTWPLEALKAQAVVARTYALYQMRQGAGVPFHLRSTVMSQVYGGLGREDSRATWAVLETRGLVLTWRGRVIASFYHACSGGQTEDGDQVFGTEFVYLVGQRDEFSGDCPHDRWNDLVPAAEFRRSLQAAGFPVGAIRAIEPLGRTRTGRIMRLRIVHDGGGLEMEAKRFRLIAGPDVVRSTLFDVAVERGLVTFAGRGWGHGVGMSQWGARGMAERAHGFADILKYYYPHASLTRTGN